MPKNVFPELPITVIILGTHHERSAMLFWSLATKLQLQGNPIVAWKFCHVAHKLLRDGHPHVSFSFGCGFIHKVNISINELFLKK